MLATAPAAVVHRLLYYVIVPSIAKALIPQYRSIGVHRNAISRHDGFT